MPCFTNFFKHMIFQHLTHMQVNIPLENPQITLNKFSYETQLIKGYQLNFLIYKIIQKAIYFGSNKILMFLRTLKVIKKQNKTQLSSPNDNSQLNKKSLKKHTFNSIENLYEIKHTQHSRLNPEYPLLPASSPYNINKNKLQSFQNQYIKAQSKKQKILDQRKQFIKDKIKGKVKEQLADLLKRSDLTHSLSTDMKIKSDFIQDTVLQVEVKGSSVKHSMRTSFTQRPQLMKLQKIRRSTYNNKYSIKQSFSHEKGINGFTLEQSPRDKMKTRRSLSNIIRMNQVVSQQGIRNVRSVLDDLRTSGKKDSLSIEPWQFVEDF